MRYSQGDGVNTSLSRLVYCTHAYYVVLVDLCSFPVCEWVSSLARSCANKDANNKDNVCKPNIPAGIKCPPPCKTISPITWFGTISAGIVQYTSGFLPYILLFTQAPILVWFDGTIIDIISTILLQCTTVVMLGYDWWLCMVINISVQYNGGFLPDVILLTQVYYHWGTRLNAM